MNSRNQNRPIDNRYIKTSEDKSNNIFEKFAVFFSYFLLVIFPFAIFFCLIIISEYERAVVLRLGRLRKQGAIGPGVCFILPCIDDAIRVDLRTASFNVPAQEVLTKDSVTIRVDAIVYFRIKDPEKAVLQVLDARAASEYLAQTTLRTIVGTKMLIELLTSRETLSQEILHALEETTDVWGVKVERVEMKDIKLPLTMQRALAQEAQAIREARAKIASAEGEMEASKALKAASDIMQESPYTLQLRYMQTLSFITHEQKSTIIFPVPIDILPPGLLEKYSDVSLPPDLQRSMAAEQEAMREAKAKIAAADGELQSSTILKEASETMAKNPIALQLRYLQTLNSVSSEKNHTIVVPFPLDIVKRLNEIFGGSSSGNSAEQNKPATKEEANPIQEVFQPSSQKKNASTQLSEDSSEL